MPEASERSGVRIPQPSQRRNDPPKERVIPVCTMLVPHSSKATPPSKLSNPVVALMVSSSRCLRSLRGETRALLPEITDFRREFQGNPGKNRSPILSYR